MLQATSATTFLVRLFFLSWTLHILHFWILSVISEAQSFEIFCHLWIIFALLWCFPKSVHTQPPARENPVKGCRVSHLSTCPLLLGSRLLTASLKPLWGPTRGLRVRISRILVWNSRVHATINSRQSRTRAELFIIARTWKQPRCPSADKWIGKLWYICTMECYSVIKKNSFESVLMRWMKLEPIIQSEVSQKDKDRYSILTHVYGI